MTQPRKFATTRWSVILAAGRATAETRTALSTLCTLYWYPVYAFARRGGLTADDANDLTQAFFTELLAGQDLRAVDPSRGRFRSWLLACFKHFQVNQRERAAAQKRGGGVADFSLDATDAEGRYQVEPGHQLTPDKLYMRRWTLSLLQRAQDQLRAECVARGQAKADEFEALKGSLVGEPDEPYAEVGRRLGKEEGAVKAAAHRLQMRHKALLNAIIADTVEHPDDVAAEKRELLASLE